MFCYYFKSHAAARSRTTCEIEQQVADNTGVCITLMSRTYFEGSKIKLR